MQKPLRTRLFISSLALSSYAEQNLDILIGLLLIDIAATFQVTPGLASQVVSFSKISAIATGLAMGALSVRFRHKSLLGIGIFILIIGMLGSMLAANLMIFQIFYPLDGVGTVIIAAMAGALIGTWLPSAARPKAIGWLVAAGSLCWIIGSPVIGVIASNAGWRSVLASFMIPIAFASLILVMLFVPSAPRTASVEKREKISYLQGYKKVLSNKSATACLITALLVAFLQSWVVYVGTFYRSSMYFSVSLELTSVILLVASFFLAFGGIIGGQIANRVGRKNLLIGGLLIRSVIIGLLVFIPYLWIVLVIDFANTFFGGMSFNALNSLNVEQVPDSRGTMLSLAAMFSAGGAALGVALGGPILDLFGFETLAPIFAAGGVIAALVSLLFAKDPCRKKVRMLTN